MKPLPPSLLAGCVLISAFGFADLAHADADTNAACPPQEAAKSDKPKTTSAMEFMKKRWGKVDTNKDGIISKEEYLKEAADRFDASDANHDNKLTPEEIKAFFDRMDAEKVKRDKERLEKAKLCAAKP